MVEADEEQLVLEGKLNNALEEAWTKANAALDETSKGGQDWAKKVWFAAEAVEYSSLLYSLTFGMEDVDPPPPNTKGRGATSLVKESVEALKLVRMQKEGGNEKTYEMLRNASHNLRTAYLSILKKSKRPK